MSRQLIAADFDLGKSTEPLGVQERLVHASGEDVVTAMFSHMSMFFAALLFTTVARVVAT